MKREIKTKDRYTNKNINFQQWEKELDQLVRNNDLKAGDETQLEKIQKLRAIDRALLQSMCIDDIEQNVLPMITGLLNAEWVGVAAISMAADEINLVATYPIASHPERNWHAPLPWAWDSQDVSGRPVHVSRNISEYHQTTPFFASLWKAGIQSIMTLPLISLGKSWGFVTFGRKTPYRWTLDDIDLASEIAASIASGIQRTHDFPQFQHTSSSSYHNEISQSGQFLFHAMFEIAPIGIAITTKDGVIVDANPALQKLIGYDKEELTNKYVNIFLEDYYRTPGAMLHNHTAEFMCLHKNGSKFPCHLISSTDPERADSGYVILMIEDISEQKRYQAVIAQAEKLSMTGKLAASLIHEINNPLQSAIGCLGLTGEVFSEGGDIRKYLSVASEELERAARIVSQLRDLNSPSGKIIRNDADLHELIEHSLMLISKQCKDRGIAVTYHQKDEQLSLPKVPEQIQQVFLNLLLNAIDAMSSGGELDILIKQTNSPIGISVSFIDTGTGMSEEVLAKIYDPFYSTKSGGLGLGLFISKSIAQDLGGSINVKSFPGKGTTFTVWLPTQSLSADKKDRIYEKTYE
jgi:two-component system, LuxR family, sensor kinase FixL